MLTRIRARIERDAKVALWCIMRIPAHPGASLLGWRMGAVWWHGCGMYGLLAVPPYRHGGHRPDQRFTRTRMAEQAHGEGGRETVFVPWDPRSIQKKYILVAKDLMIGYHCLSSLLALCDKRRYIWKPSCHIKWFLDSSMR